MQLADLLNAEKQLVKALPKAAKNASSDELRDAIESHLQETQEHVTRLERIIEGLENKPKAHKCAAMQGLVEEAGEVLESDGDPAVKDAAIIAGAQRIEHYEIAGYGCARTFANMLGRTEDADLLQATLDEEHAADRLLNQLAETVVNHRAAHT
jgi:ferritin-like metal-binding protein YciE